MTLDDLRGKIALALSVKDAGHNKPMIDAVLAIAVEYHQHKLPEEIKRLRREWLKNGDDDAQQLVAAQAKLELVGAALRRYGEHGLGCYAFDDTVPDERCDCGLREALVSLKTDQPDRSHASSSEPCSAEVQGETQSGASGPRGVADLDGVSPATQEHK